MGRPAKCNFISAWRRAVSGDLTGAIDFANPVYGLPSNLPAAAQVIDRKGTCDPLPNPTSANAPNSLPNQESGRRPARALPYQPDANVSSIEYGSNGKILLWIQMQNVGSVATHSVHLAAYANAYRSGGPWQYTLTPYSNGSNGSVADFFNIGTGYGSGAYDLSVIGPNRFMRRFAGNTNNAGKGCNVTSSYAFDPNSGKLALYFTLTNTGSQSVTFTIKSNNYVSGGPWLFNVGPGSSVQTFFPVVANSNGWYDFSLTVSGDSAWLRRYTGHMESGVASITG